MNETATILQQYEDLYAYMLKTMAVPPATMQECAKTASSCDIQAMRQIEYIKELEARFPEAAKVASVLKTNSIVYGL